MKITVDNVKKQFEKHNALNGVSFEINQGSILGLLGPNGAGKTTFIRTLNQIIYADSGQILINQRPYNKDDIKSFGYLPEERGLYKKMKVGKQAVYLARLKSGKSKKEIKDKLQEWFERFDILDWWNKKPEELSKGMQQKVQFIISILHDPDLVILDEPFSGFDPVNAEVIKNEILRMHQEGKTIILSTHNMASVEELCDEVVLLNMGNVVLKGKLEDIKDEFKENIFEICVSGDTQKLSNIKNVSIIKTHQKGRFNYVRFKNNAALNFVELSQTFQDFTIRSMREVLPSMQEIFVKSVK